MTERLLEATISVRGVVFTRDDEVLVLKHADTGEWELPGGRLEPDELPVDGLHREIGEETSLAVEVHGTVHAHAWRNGDDDGRFGVYYCCATDDRAVSLSDEHSESVWAPQPAARELLSDVQATAVRNAHARRSEETDVATE